MGLVIAQIDVTTFADETSWYLLLPSCGLHGVHVAENDACQRCIEVGV
jgi:hypothetical protein